MRGLESLLRPRSVAVIGASDVPTTFSGAPVFNLQRHGYTGAIYPVNPKRSELRGLTSYPTVTEVPGEVDTAIIAVPTGAVLGVLADCVAKGIPSATIITSGFSAEGAGPEGRERGEKLAALIRESGMRVLGPNTAGLVNLNDGYVPRAAHNQLDPDRVKPGAVALLTQSGACSNILFNQAQANGVGIGLSVATGDQVDVDLWELCDFALDDPRITVILVVAETLGEASRVERVALHAARSGKLVALLKLGRSELGRQAVMTHSGSLAGDAAVQAAALRQLGIVQATELDELWRLAALATAWGLPTPGPRRLGVVSFSGGEGALIADHCSDNGIALPPPSDAYKAFIKASFEYATAANPFDPSGEIIGRPEKIRIALRAYLEQNDYTDVLIATPVLHPDQARRQLGEIDRILDQPRPNLCFSYRAAGDFTGVQESILAATGQPVFREPKTAVQAIAMYRDAADRRREPRVREATVPSGTPVAADAPYFAVRAALAGLGARFPLARLVHSAEDASRAATAIGFPVVMKANVPSSTHKFANGLIALDVRTPEDAGRAHDDLRRNGAAFGADGVVVEGLGRGQIEVMIGGTRDADFGATLLFGAGGMTVEHAGDSALLVARYADEGDADRLVRATRIGAFLGERAPEAARTLAALVTRVGDWFAGQPQLTGLDLNPLLVDLATQEVACVDARVA